MALSLEQKKAVVSEVREVAARAQSAIGAEYRGLSAADMDTLRKEAREAGVFLRVVKNNLAKRAVEDTPFACIREELVGPLLLAFSEDEPGAAARLIRKFAKENEQLAVKIVSAEGQLLAPGDIERLATLPTKDEAIARLMGVMKAPVEQLARTLAAPQSKLVRTFAAYRDKQQAA